jgi:uncharacterized protein (TIGR02145 family)
MMPDNKIWMTANLNIHIPGSYGYENATQKSDQYGRLYTWTSAQGGCRLLGAGWRLPTNAEWQKMASAYGGVRDDSQDGGAAAYQALIKGGSAAFNAVYGGGRDAAGNYARVGAHGFYWTATESDTANAWLYNFGMNGKILNRHPDGEKYGALSVRCVRDVSQTNGQPGIVGNWRARKVVAFQDVPYDLDQKDATHAQVMRWAKEKSPGDSMWRHRDSANMEKRIQYTMEGLEKRRLELRADNTFLSEGLFRPDDPSGNTHEGTYRYDARQFALELLNNKGISEATFTAHFPNDSTLVLTGKDRSSMIPVITYRKESGGK